MSSAMRLERDAFGEIAVAQNALWGAQTQRSLQYFAISKERMPTPVVMALVRIKRAAAEVNAELGLLPQPIAQAIQSAADEVLTGLHPNAFPLMVWQTGSGTQSNMNVNEVLANRASELMGGERGMHRLVHPNDHVNMGQSSNDVFPSAMHVAACEGVMKTVLPALDALHLMLTQHAHTYADLVKIGRTHLQDATPLTLGQEISGWAAQLAQARHAIVSTMDALTELAIGGTAVGTGLNTHPEFGARVAEILAQASSLPFRVTSNRFAALAANDAMVSTHGALKVLAVALMKIANDVRWLASGPRCGLGELQLPENEPGSSIMPGKVNPTQCEALTMVCAQVMGNDVAMSVGGSMGNFELNVFKPLLAHNFMQSVRLLSDGMHSFAQHCVAGMRPDEARIAQLLSASLMLVTALAPHIGYDQAAQIAKHAHANGLSLRESAMALGLVSAEQFEAWVKPEAMVSNRIN